MLAHASGAQSAMSVLSSADGTAVLFAKGSRSVDERGGVITSTKGRRKRASGEARIFGGADPPEASS